MAEWQDIASAPKDGAPILAAGEVRDGSWVQTTVRWENDGEGYWNLIVVGAYAEDGEWWPTHWMPLPEPPSNGANHG
jgi:hypothetical protein